MRWAPSLCLRGRVALIVAATALAASGVATGAATSISARSADHTERSAVLKSVALASWELEEALRLAAIRRR